MDELSLALAEEQDQQAVKYVLAMLAGVSKTDIAESLGISRQYLYKLERRWEEDGTLERIFREVLVNRAQAIQVAVDDVLREYPMLIAEAKRIALHGRSERVRLEAIEWLHQRVVQPALAGKTETGLRESAYSKSVQTFDPAAIPDGDIEVIVQTRTPTIITQK